MSAYEFSKYIGDMEMKSTTARRKEMCRENIKNSQRDVDVIETTVHFDPEIEHKNVTFINQFNTD